MLDSEFHEAHIRTAVRKVGSKGLKRGMAGGEGGIEKQRAIGRIVRLDHVDAFLAVNVGQVEVSVRFLKSRRTSIECDEK